MLPVAFYEGFQTTPSQPSVVHNSRNYFRTVMEGLKKKTIKPEDVSLIRTGAIMGLIDPLDIQGSYQEHCAQLHRNGLRSTYTEAGLSDNTESYFSESNTGLLSNAFGVLINTLLGTSVIDGYNNAEGMIADSLVTTLKVNRRKTNIPGLTKLGGGSEVEDGHPYNETDFTTKWVQTFEKKHGNVLSISEELLYTDQTGLIALQAREMGAALREYREIDMINQITDQSGKTYFPSGTATTLYSSTNQNLIGSGGISGYTSAVALVDWTDINEVRTCRATKVVDDRIDGTPRPIAGLNGPAKLLVPVTLDTTARNIQSATQVVLTPGSTSGSSQQVKNPVGGMFEVYSSPYLDAISAADWYYGQFEKQFVYTELWPIQTFMQGSDSEAAFERDVAMRVKVRYLGGLTARDTVYVTKVKGS